MNYELQKLKMEMDKKHENSMLYTIRSNKTDKYYVGSTYQILSKRLYDHKRLFKSYWKHQRYSSSFEILQYEDAYIEILEDHKGMNRHVLFKLENEFIRNNREKVINVIGGKRPMITKEHKEELINISKQLST